MRTKSPRQGHLERNRDLSWTQPVHWEETREINVLSFPSSLLLTCPCPHWLHFLKPEVTDAHGHDPYGKPPRTKTREGRKIK